MFRTWTMRLRPLGLAVAILAVCIAGTFVLSTVVEQRVYIGDQLLASPNDETLRKRLEERVSAPITLTWEGYEASFDPAELGLAVNLRQALEEAAGYRRTHLARRVLLLLTGRLEPVQIPVPVDVDVNFLRRSLETVFGRVFQPPQDARLRGSERTIVPEEWGWVVDFRTLTAALKEVVLRAEGMRRVEIPVQSLRPRVTADQLTAWNELHVLGQMVTGFAADQTARVHNIKTAAQRVDGIVLLPGDVFSLNAATGERSEQTGYLPAPVIVDGEYVQGVGGGVSQLASTIFNAALLAGMEITEYHNHSLPVSYLPIGRDATVWYDSLDLRFRNTHLAAVVLHVSVGANWVQATIVSPRPSGLQVTVETQIAELYPPPVEERIDPTLPAGARRLEEAGGEGQRVEIRQRLATGGEVVVERVLEARYVPRPQRWAVGKE